MNFQKKIRDMQDKLRNSGWRIEWIPWQEDGRPEVICSKNPLALIGAAIFVSSVFLGGRRFIGIKIEETGIIIIAVSGLALCFLGIIIAAFQRQAGWKCVEAKCVDREIGECMKEPGQLTSDWAFRLLCEFDYAGKRFKVTPENSNLAAFGSERKVQAYLDERIKPDGSCRLWIDPANPLHAIFDKKRWWL